MSSPVDRPVLRFGPAAWAKLKFFCHAGDTEIGGFGICASDDLLLIEEFATISQRTSAITVAFDDRAVADFFETQVDAGRTPEEFARVWLHSHPGDCPLPSAIDEATFARVFGGCDWAIMFVLARGGQTYCRLRFNSGPGGSMTIPVEVDYAQPFAGSDHASWLGEYERNIHIDTTATRGISFEPWGDLDTFDSPNACEADALLGDDLFEFDFDDNEEDRCAI